MAGVKGRSGPPGNQNNFKHGLAAIQKRREESVTPISRQNGLDGTLASVQTWTGLWEGDG